jgi:hypothetical protein
VGLGELPVGRGIEVEDLDRDADLVRPQLGPGVEPLRGLRQGGTCRLEHAVQTHRRRRDL